VFPFAEKSCLFCFLKDHPVAELRCTGQTLHSQSLMQADLGLFCVKKEAEGNFDEQQCGGSAERILGKSASYGWRGASRGARK
jgi:hypothetical protein